MKYLVSQVEQWGDELETLAPDPGRRKVGKREAVLLLARQLQAAARRGLSALELRAALAAKGLEVHIDLVREALRSAGKTAGATAGRRRRRSAASSAPEVGADTDRGEPAGPERSQEGPRDVAADVMSESESAGPRPNPEVVADVVGVAPVVDPGTGTGVLADPVPDKGWEREQPLSGKTTVAAPAFPPGVDSGSTRKESRGAATAATSGERSVRPAPTGPPPDAKPGTASVPRGTFVPRSDSETI
jgi:hypothetical protein